MRSPLVYAVLASHLVGLAPSANAVNVSRPIPGYICMSLNITDAQAHDFSFQVPFHSEPNPGSSTIGAVTASVAVRSPLHEVNGFIEALTLTGRVGWVPARFLKAHSSPLDPTARCVPVVLPDGRLGFAYPH